MRQWTEVFVDGGEKVGRTFLVVDEELQRKGMEAAGFVDIQEYNWKVRERVHAQSVGRRRVIKLTAAYRDLSGLGLRTQISRRWEI